MPKTNAKKAFAKTAKVLMRELFEASINIELITLATCDGFSVCSLSRGLSHFEEDKMSAAASTLHSVSDAVAKQILNKQFDITIIETEAGNVAFIALRNDDSDYVLAMSANAQVNIASLRLQLKRLAQSLTESHFEF